MSTYVHVTDLLSAYALDCLDDEESILVSEHLVTCEHCRNELQSFQVVVDQLAFAAPEATPPADLKDRILSRLQSETAPTPVKTRTARVPWWQALGIALQHTAPAWGVVCLLLAVGFGISSWNFWQQLHPQPNEIIAEHDKVEDMFKVVKLGRTPQAPNAAGHLMIGKDGQYALLIVVGLPAPKPGYMYQLWAVREGERESGGMFTVTSDGYGSMTISIPRDLLGYSHFVVTMEPSEGSHQPTGTRVLETKI